LIEAADAADLDASSFEDGKTTDKFPLAG